MHMQIYTCIDICIPYGDLKFIQYLMFYTHVSITCTSYYCYIMYMLCVPTSIPSTLKQIDEETFDANSRRESGDTGGIE